MAGEVERKGGGEQEGWGGRERDRKGREESTSARRRTHAHTHTQGENTITEGHYQMRCVKLPGISTPPPPATMLPCSLPSFSLLFSSFLFSLFLHFNDKSWWVGPAWDGQRHTILLAINLRL